jgi:hypothetical protein
LLFASWLLFLTSCFVCLASCCLLRVFSISTKQ